MEFAPNNDSWFNIARNGQDPKQYYKEGKRAAENIGRTLGERTNYEQKRNMENRNEQKTQEDMNKALEHAQTRKEETRVKRERRSEEHTSELQSRGQLVCRLLLEKKKQKIREMTE